MARPTHAELDEAAAALRRAKAEFDTANNLCIEARGRLDAAEQAMSKAKVTFDKLTDALITD